MSNKQLLLFNGLMAMTLLTFVLNQLLYNGTTNPLVILIVLVMSFTTYHTYTNIDNDTPLEVTLGVYKFILSPLVILLLFMK